MIGTGFRAMRAVLCAGVALGATAGQAVADHCFRIDARAGWQVIRPPTGWLVDITWEQTEGWSVDERNYGRVDPYGHSGADGAALERWSQFKYSQEYRFGEMLIADPGNLKEFMSVGAFLFTLDMYNGWEIMPNNGIAFRINDSDATLGDNGGSQTVCLILE